MPLFLKILNAFWPFEDCYWPGFVFVQLFLLPKAALYKDIQTGVPANKTPLFHSRLGSPASLFSSTLVPRSWSVKTITGRYQSLPLGSMYKPLDQPHPQGWHTPEARGTKHLQHEKQRPHTHRKLDKMRLQRNMSQIKAQDKTPEEQLR